jgi:PPOX class probable F420-dependent enzyme
MDKEHSMLDLSTERDRAIERRLREDIIIWLSTIGANGRPHSVPVWFWWDGDAILIYSEPGTRKVRDLRQNPSVVLALETRDDGEEVAFFEGKAELLAEPTSVMMPPAYGEKYARLFPRIGSTPEKMKATHSQVIRVRSARVKAWGIGGG